MGSIYGGFPKSSDTFLGPNNRDRDVGFWVPLFWEKVHALKPTEP